MNEKITQAKEKATEAKREIVDRVNKQQIILPVVMVLFVVISGIGPLGTMAPVQPVTAIHEGDEEVYYATNGEKLNKSYAANGSVIWSYNPPSDTGAYDIAIGPYGNIHFRSDNKIHEITPEGNRVNSFTTEYLGFLKIDRNGNYYARSVSNNNRIAKLNSDGGTKWTFTADATVTGLEFDKNKSVFIGTDGGNVRAIESDGNSTLWNKTGYSGSPSDLRVDYNGGLIFAVNSVLKKISLGDGASQWSKNPPDTITSIDTTTEGDIYVATEDSSSVEDAYRYKNDGSLVWSNGVDSTLNGIEIGKHGNLYADSKPTTSQTIIKLNPDDGSKDWLVTMDGKNHGLSAGDPFRAQPSGSLELDITDYQEPNSTREYRVYRIENGERHNVTANATVTSSNSTVITVNSGNYTLESGTVNTTANVTAEYDGLSDSVEVTVSEIDMNYISILPPAYWTTSIIVDPTMQWLFVAIVIGAVAGQMSRNKWAGMGTIQTVILIGWAIDLVDDGILMAAIAFLIFAGLITMQGSSGAEPVE